MRGWLYWHFPIITTRWRRNKRIEQVVVNQLESTIRLVGEINDKSNWAAINPIIHDLETLRADTWNQDKITKIQNWLRDNFEVKDDKSRHNT